MSLYKNKLFFNFLQNSFMLLWGGGAIQYPSLAYSLQHKLARGIWKYYFVDSDWGPQIKWIWVGRARRAGVCSQREREAEFGESGK